MKFVAIGDLHSHNWKDFSVTKNVEWDEKACRYYETEQEEGQSVVTMNSRLLNILNALADVRDYCISNSIKLCLCAGDMYHARGSVETTVFNATYKMFESFYQVGIEVIMLAGNHDQTSSMVFSENSLYPYQMMNQVISEPKVVTYSDGGEALNIVCLPYSKDKKMIMDALTSMIKQTDKDEMPRILLGHLGISGGLVGSGNFVMSDEYNLMELKAPKFKYCVFGHYHKPQVLEYNSIYTGSIVQNTFNDEGDDHGFWVIDTKRRWDMQLVPLDYPKFITITKDNIKSFTAEELAKNFVRVQASAKDSEEIMAELEDKATEVSLDRNLKDIIRLEVEKDYDTDSRSDISITMDMPEILKTYVEENNTTDLSTKELLEKGLHILFSVQGKGVM